MLLLSKGPTFEGPWVKKWGYGSGVLADYIWIRCAKIENKMELIDLLNFVDIDSFWIVRIFDFHIAYIISIMYRCWQNIHAFPSDCNWKVI